MTEPVFIDYEAVVEIHEDELAVSGGLAGIRDDNALQSAIAAPENLFVYADADVVQLAGAYLVHIAMNHGFTDGNKRTGYITCLTFLRLNGIDLGAPPSLEIATLAVASKLIDQAALTGILRQLVILATDDPNYYAKVHATRPA